MGEAMSVKPSFDSEKCNLCGLCTTVCECHRFILADGKLTMSETVECQWCQQCELVCPTGAITFPFEVVIEPQG